MNTQHKHKQLHGPPCCHSAAANHLRGTASPPAHFLRRNGSCTMMGTGTLVPCLRWKSALKRCSSQERQAGAQGRGQVCDTKQHGGGL